MSLQLPGYLRSKIKAGYDDRKANQWKGLDLLRPRPAKPSDILLCNNDYLCLLSDTLLTSEWSAWRCRNDHKDQILGSPAFLPMFSFQYRVEEKFASYLGMSEAIMCQSGWSANFGLVQTITEKDTPCYIDFLAHPSFLEGIKSAGALAVHFKHNDVAHARSLVEEKGPGVIIVDSVYSINGSVAPISEFVELASSTGCILVVDESHAIGTHGPQGRGLVAQLALSNRVNFITGSLSKGFAGRAGVIAFPKYEDSFKNYFSCEALPTIFSSALLDHELKWFDLGLDFMHTEGAEERRQALRLISPKIRAELSRMGYRVDSGTEQIIGVQVDTELNLKIFQDEMMDRGVFAAPFCPPATPKNKSILRLTINSGLSLEQVDKIIDMFQDAMPAARRLGMLK